LLIACGALAREILDLKAANGWTHLDLTCLPAKLHLYPDQITEAVRDAVAKHRDAYETIFVVYADCGTGGLLQAACVEMGVEMIAGPHCYSFFEGNDRFAETAADAATSAAIDLTNTGEGAPRQHNDRFAETAADEMTTFYLTDFLVRQFDAFVWKPMGLDKHPELRDMIFGNYTKLIYQAQTDDPKLTAQAEDCARRLGLAFERRFTGYGDLKTALSNL
jgi:hypothetical protein